MKKIVIFGLATAAVAVMVVGAVLVASGGGKDSKDTASKPDSSANAPKPKQADDSGDATQPAQDSATNTAEFTITANDNSASLTNITVSKGVQVTINFNVSAQGTYYGGLQFKNDELGIDSGGIKTGESGKVVFTATKSFDLTPYWYQSGVKKDYKITITVE